MSPVLNICATGFPVLRCQTSPQSPSLVTAYIPDTNIWLDGFTTRRQR